MLTVQIGQAALVGNQCQASSPWAYTFQDASSDVDLGALYLNVEGVAADTARAIAQEIARSYFESDSASAETALLRSVRSAYRHLYDAHAGESLANVGLTAVVILADRAPIAQVIPTQFYLIQDDEVTALPDTDDRLAGADAPSVQESRYPQWDPPVEMFRALPQAQDVAVLCTDSIGAVVSNNEIQDIVRQGSIQSAAENLVDTARQRGEQQASALLLRFVAARESVETAAEAPAAAAQTPSPAGPQRSANALSAAMGLLLALLILAWSLVTSLFRPRAQPSESPSGATPNVAMGSTIVTRSAADQARRQRVSRLIAGAVVILLLIVLVIGANALFGDRDTPGSLAEDPTATPQAQITPTLQPVAEAASPSPAVASAPTATPTLEPSTPGAVLLSTSQDLVQFDPGVQQPGEIYGLDSTVYVLDRASGVVYRIGSDGRNEIVYQPGDTAITGSAARHITGRNDVIQILDSENRLFHATNDQAPQVVQLPSDSVQQPRSTATYDENIYLLDTAANEVHRFRPVGSGVYSEPEGYFGINSGVDLSQATDLAIDGSVFILFSDGTINRYVAGARAEFSLATLPSPLGTPGAIFISQGMGSLYILDGDNDRIVQVTTEGVYQRQFQAQNRQIADAIDVFVNPEETSLWLVGPTRVTRFPLPSLPEDAPRSGA